MDQINLTVYVYLNLLSHTRLKDSEYAPLWIQPGRTRSFLCLPSLVDIRSCALQSPETCNLVLHSYIFTPHLAARVIAVFDAFCSNVFRHNCCKSASSFECSPYFFKIACTSHNVANHSLLNPASSCNSFYLCRELSLISNTTSTTKRCKADANQIAKKKKNNKRNNLMYTYILIKFDKKYDIFRT